MKKLMTVTITVLFCLSIMVTFAQARNGMLTGVNETCGTSYDCGICHIDPAGKGPLTADGDGYAASGNDSCYFCADVCGGTVCNDADTDGYFAESNCGTSVDCVDSDPAINPGAVEVCDDGIDNDCDGTTDCADNECEAQCPSTSPENCVDGIDNDGDRKVDCADRDCRKDPACTSGDTGGSEGKGKTCSDGQDNDGDGATDCDDSDCSRSKACK